MTKEFKYQSYSEMKRIYEYISYTTERLRPAVSNLSDEIVIEFLDDWVAALAISIAEREVNKK